MARAVALDNSWLPAARIPITRNVAEPLNLQLGFCAHLPRVGGHAGGAPALGWPRRPDGLAAAFCSPSAGIPSVSISPERQPRGRSATHCALKSGAGAAQTDLRWRTCGNGAVALAALKPLSPSRQSEEPSQQPRSPSRVVHRRGGLVSVLAEADLRPGRPVIPRGSALYNLATVHGIAAASVVRGRPVPLRRPRPPGFPMARSSPAGGLPAGVESAGGSEFPQAEPSLSAVADRRAG